MNRMTTQLLVTGLFLGLVSTIPVGASQRFLDRTGSTVEFLEREARTRSSDDPVLVEIGQVVRGELLELERSLRSEAPGNRDRGKLREIRRWLRRLDALGAETAGTDLREPDVEGGSAGGSISGLVTRSSNASPLAGIVIALHDEYGSFLDATATSGSGSFTFSGLAFGNYKVRTHNGIGLVDEVWDDVVCHDSCPIWDLGSVIAVESSGAVVGIDFVLEYGGAISGRVTLEDSGAAVGYFHVSIYDSIGKFLAAVDPYDDFLVDGYYTAGGLPTGTYYAIAQGDYSNLSELYEEIDCLPGCDVLTGTPILVASAETTSDINFTLGNVAGGIEGRVTDELTGLGIPGIDVEVSGPTYEYGSTDGTGHYSISSLLPGEYTSYAHDYGGRYEAEYWDDVPCNPSCDPGNATPILVADDAVTPDINFQLTPTASISGTVRAKGQPVSSASITLYDPTRSYVDSAYTDGSGHYTFRGLSRGTYFAVSVSPWLDQVYSGEPCNSYDCPIDGGTPIEVATSQAVTGIDFNLMGGGTITGRVIDQLTAQPIGGAFVQIYSLAHGAIDSQVTDLAGYFITTSLELSGIHYAVAAANHHEAELWLEMPCSTYCDPYAGNEIAVTPGLTTSGVEFSLLSMATIGGRVTLDADSYSYGYVEIYDENGEYVTASYADGVWQIDLPAGTYYALARGDSNDVPMLYDDIQCIGWCDPTLGTPIVVGPGDIVPGIDFTLRSALFLDGFESGGLWWWDSF